MTSIAQSDTSGVPQRLVSHVGATPTIYLMARVSDYDTCLYDDALAYLTHAYPRTTVFPARDLWRSGRHWLACWPAFQQSVELGVVTSTGPIGPGVARELFDLANRQVPLAWLADGNEPTRGCVLHAQFRIELVDGDSTTHFGRLVPSTDAPDFHPILSEALARALAAWG